MSGGNQKEDPAPEVRHRASLALALLVRSHGQQPLSGQGSSPPRLARLGRFRATLVACLPAGPVAPCSAHGPKESSADYATARIASSTTQERIDRSKRNEPVASSRSPSTWSVRPAMPAGAPSRSPGSLSSCLQGPSRSRYLLVFRRRCRDSSANHAAAGPC